MLGYLNLGILKSAHITLPSLGQEYLLINPDGVQISHAGDKVADRPLQGLAFPGALFIELPKLLFVLAKIAV